ncbi:MAG: rod shape-determining protein MreC [Alistipes sp.]|nr:rod shape-determining protein MreC [Alistipes sp.]
MYKLIEFFRRIYVVLLFILIETVALNYYAHSSYYTQAKILSRANSVFGSLQGSVFSIKHFFTLRKENIQLSERIAQLEGQLAYYREKDQNAKTDSLSFDQMDSTLYESLSQYRYTTARIIQSTVSHNRNYITLNRGLMHGVVEDMAVITPTGVMVGYVVGCSERYSVVLPLLNTDFRTSGKIVGDENFGSIYWDGHSPYKVQMTELSKYAQIEEGQEVIASGLSHYFPEGIRIGYVDKITLNENQTSYDIEIRLAANMTKLNNVLLIENIDYGEISHLEQSKNGKE